MPCGTPRSFSTVRLRGFHPLRRPFPEPSAQSLLLQAAPLSLATTRRIVSFPQATWMFRFTWFPRHPYVFRLACLTMPSGGFPHSDISGSFGCTHLPGAFRSVPRPSSADIARSFPLRPASFFRSNPVLQRSCFSRAGRVRCSPEHRHALLRVTSRVFTMRLLRCPEVVPRSRAITPVIPPDRLTTPHKNGPTISSGRPTAPSLVSTVSIQFG